jgi:hypothetical protein
MSNTEENPVERDQNDDGPEFEDLEIAKEESDAVTGGNVSSESPSGKKFGA